MDKIISTVLQKYDGLEESNARSKKRELEKRLEKFKMKLEEFNLPSSFKPSHLELSLQIHTLKRYIGLYIELIETMLRVINKQKIGNLLKIKESSGFTKDEIKEVIENLVAYIIGTKEIYRMLNSETNTRLLDTIQRTYAIDSYGYTPTLYIDSFYEPDPSFEEWLHIEGNILIGPTRWDEVLDGIAEMFLCDFSSNDLALKIIRMLLSAIKVLHIEEYSDVYDITFLLNSVDKKRQKYK